MNLGPGQQDVEYGISGEIGVVPVVLNHGDEPSSLQERVLPGTQEQLGLLPDPWLPSKRHTERTCAVPQAAHTDTHTTPIHTNEGVPNICRPLPSDSQTKGLRGDEECVDLVEHMEAHGHKSIFATIHRA